MSSSIRKTAYATFALFALLFINLNWLQVFHAEELAEHPSNRRQLLAEYDIRRGAITVGVGTEQRTIATSVETADQLRFLREYPDGPTYAHITGFHSFIFGRSQLESTYNDFLQASSSETVFRNLVRELQGQELHGDTVVTTIDPAGQQAAVTALGSNRGAVIALNPRTGDVLVMASSPTYNPSELSGHEGSAIREAWDRLENDPKNPRLNRATSETYAPGSTFKLITAALALERGATLEQSYPDPSFLDLPQTNAQIGNYSRGRPCNDGQTITLINALRVSCNTTFGLIALEAGPEALVDQAEAFGFNNEIVMDVPTAVSRIPQAGDLDPPATAQSGIGQRDVRATPLQMAMVASAIANDGVMMSPRLVTEVQDYTGMSLRQISPTQQILPNREGGQSVSPQTAEALTQMMVSVVQNGTGRSVAIDGVTVAGKTGTAQQGSGEPPNVWFVGFAPAEDPQIAIAVIVEDGGEAGRRGTGGSVAGPIARTVIEAVLQ